MILLAYGLAFAGLVTRRGDLLVLSVPIVLYLGISLWRSPGEVRLEIQRRLEFERVAPDSPVGVTVTIQNLGNDLNEVCLEDNLPVGLQVSHGAVRHLIGLQPGQTYSWTYHVQGPRGYYVFSDVKVEAGDLFRLLPHKRSYPVRGQLFILPTVKHIQRVAIHPRRTNVYSGTIPARKGGAGVEFFDVRAYQPGDPPHWINWKVSARHSEALFSNAYEQERVADIAIVLDGRLRTNMLIEGHSLFEHSIQAAASMADTFLAQGNQVGLLLYGHYLHWTFPGYGKLQRERILQSLARAEPGNSTVFENLAHIPTRLFPAHSQVVLISPITQGDYSALLELRARGYQVMVISPNPIQFEKGYLPKGSVVDMAGRILSLERDLMLQKLRSAGVQTLDWNVVKPFDQISLTTLGRPRPWFKLIGR